MARIFITGGCGFIGSHLASFHLLKGDEVLVVDDLSSGSLNNLASFQDNYRLHIENENILTWSGLKNAVKWANRIYHMAAIVGIFKVIAEPVEVVKTNIGGCERLLHAVIESGARPRIVLASSSSVYGASKTSVLNEDDDLIIKIQGYSLSTYAISKLSQEAIAFAYYRAHQLPITLVRLFNVIGQRQTGRYGMVVPRFIQQACKNEPLTIFGDGSQTRSFCDVRDAIVAMDLLTDHVQTIGEIINVGNDHEISINELATLVKSQTNSQSLFEYIPYEKAYGPGFKDTAQRRPDIGKLFRLTGFKPQWHLENTITELAANYRQYAN